MVTNGHTSLALPLVDISRFRGPAEDRAAFLAELRHAAHDVGFFYVVGHGVPVEITDGIFAAGRRFFALPLEQRLEIETVNSPQFRGYTRVGAEHTGGAPDWREQLDIGPERPTRDPGPDDPAWQVFTGSLLTRWTNGLLRPGRHRVVAGGTVTRLSSGVFWHPRVDTVVQPLAPFIGPDGPEFDPILLWDTVKDNVEEYLRVFGRPDQVAAWRDGRPYVAALADA